ncbi:MAG: aldose 1-epimerase [Pseudonocardiales bacterium]|nr:aldose 1-epimerase [Pseudonocardiales bacterium]
MSGGRYGWGMAITGTWYELSAGDYRARVSEVGAGLAGLEHAGRHLTAPWPAGALPPMSSGAVLMPWPNRIRDGHYSFAGKDYQLPLSEPAQHNASHGLVRWERWALGSRDESSVTLTLDLVPQTGYPFELSFALRYALAADSGMTVAVTATNIGRDAAPFGAGFHPYLDLNGHDIDHAEVDIPVATMLLTDERQIPAQRSPVNGTPYQLTPRRPIGSLRVDHGFTDLTDSKALVAVGDQAVELWWSEQFKYLQVFTPPVERFGRTALAIEPMTCAANAFNSGEGLISLEPGQVWTASWGITSLS